MYTKLVQCQTTGSIVFIILNVVSVMMLSIHMHALYTTAPCIQQLAVYNSSAF